MEERILLQIGSRKVHLIKLIGAFMVVGSALMMLSALYNLVSMASVFLGPSGHSVTLNMYGLTLSRTVAGLGIGAKVGMVFLPVAEIMFWAALLSFGAVLYRTGGITLPITEKKSFGYPEINKEDNKEGRERKRYLEAKGDSNEFVCPDCGSSFASKRGLNIHRSKSHGE